MMMMNQNQQQQQHNIRTRGNGNNNANIGNNGSSSSSDSNTTNNGTTIIGSSSSSNNATTTTITSSSSLSPNTVPAKRILSKQHQSHHIIQQPHQHMKIMVMIQIIISLCFIWLLSSCFISIISIIRDNNNNNNEYDTNNNSRMMTIPTITSDSSDSSHDSDSNNNHCAILFWGLPRSFRTLVLPSIIQNIIIPNSIYQCDYYIHYYYQREEIAGRSGLGGVINPNDILLLKDSILNITTEMSDYVPIIQFMNHTEDEFWSINKDTINTIRNTKDDSGKNYLYYPWKAKTYQHPTTTDNIIKMWFSIQSVFNLMEQSNRKYEQIGMFRSDVVYITPIDIYENPIIINEHEEQDNASSAASKNIINNHHNQPLFVVIPNFGNYPISDRMIYGCYYGVKLWATTRFNLLYNHIQWIHNNDIGWGLHSERYINYTILPYIRSNGTTTITSPSNNHNHNNNEDIISVIQHPTLCFVRSRSDESIWLNDCIVGLPSTNTNKKKNKVISTLNHVISDPRIYKKLGGSIQSIQKHIENIIGRTCTSMKSSRKTVIAINCSSSSSSSSINTIMTTSS